MNKFQRMKDELGISVTEVAGEFVDQVFTLNKDQRIASCITQCNTPIAPLGLEDLVCQCAIHLSPRWGFVGRKMPGLRG